MNNPGFMSVIKERFQSFYYLTKEGYRLKDKGIILEYYLRAPLQLLNYLTGRKNSRNLIGDVFIKNKYGLFFCGNNFSSVFGSSSMCEPEVRKEFILKEGVAMDIGANCGMFTIYLAKMLGDNGKVISIEPERRNITLLKKNVELNKLKNVSIIEKGVYSKKGKMTFYLDDFGTGGHSLLKEDVKKKEIIRIDTIDNIIKSLNIKKINIIKMDVEGVEIDALKGAEKTIKKSRPKIIFEAVKEEEKKKIENFLSQYNYKVRKIGEWNYVAEI